MSLDVLNGRIPCSILIRVEKRNSERSVMDQNFRQDKETLISWTRIRLADYRFATTIVNEELEFRLVLDIVPCQLEPLHYRGEMEEVPKLSIIYDLYECVFIIDSSNSVCEDYFN